MQGAQGRVRKFRGPACRRSERDRRSLSLPRRIFSLESYDSHLCTLRERLGLGNLGLAAGHGQLRTCLFLRVEERAQCYRVVEL